MAIKNDQTEYCPEILEDISELPDDRTIIELAPTRRKRRASKMEARDWARLLADAGSSPDGEVIHDPDCAPLVRTERDVELAILGLDPDTIHPACDWCEKEERHGLSPEVRGRWYMHIDCYVDAEQHGLRSIKMPAVEWDADEQSPALSCGLRNKPRPPALTEGQLAEVVTLRQWKFNQTQIAERLGVNQASVCRALVKAETRGQMPAKVQREQSAIDWFREVA